VSQSVVLLHGFTNTGASWAPVIRELGERYSAMAPDIRGHGDAADRRPVTFEACVADVLDAAPDRFVLVGYSMGGRLALQLAFTDPTRVQALVLIGATAGIADPAARAERLLADELLAGELESGLDMAAFAERWASQELFEDQPAPVAELARADRLRNTPAGLAAALRGIGTGAMEPLWDRLDRLPMPTTLVVGERDEKFSAIADELAQRMRDARIVRVPRCGHAVHLEAPGAVASVIDSASTTRTTFASGIDQ
jgi:2-succinyl-6-hydroxy-2,4-cyclohexadiene-1-carboxylate synthase